MAVKSDIQIMAERDMAAAKAKKAAQTATPTNTPTPSYNVPSSSSSSSYSSPSPSYSVPSTPSPSYSSTSNSPNTKVVNGVTYYQTGDTWGTVDRSKPNQAQTTQMQGQLQSSGTVSDGYKDKFGMTATPTYNYYTPPTNYGVDSQGKPLTEQQWISGGGLNNLSGKSELGTYKTNDGRYLDTSNMSSQQVHAAMLMDEVAAGKRTQESAMAVLSGMGLDKYGNQALPNSYSPSENSYQPPSAVSGVSTIPNASGSYTAPNLNQEQLDYFNRQYGGIDSYVGNQQDRYNQAYQSGDQDLISRLNSDAQRVGYTLNAPTPRQQPPSNVSGTPQGSTPQPFGQLNPNQIQNEASYTINKERSDLQTAADKSSTALRDNAAYANRLLNDSRTLQDFQQSNSVNPFTQGKQTWDKGLIGRQRGIDDTYLAKGLESELNAIQQDLYNFDKLAPDRQRMLINEMTRIERDYGIAVGTLMGEFNGERTLAGQAQDWQQSPDNPSNINMSLNNKIKELEFSNLPEEIKLGLESLRQEVATGELNHQEAEIKLKELQDPNSYTNQVKALELKMAELEAANLPETQRLELQKLRKQISDIGVVHYKPQTAAEIAEDKVKLAVANKQIADIEAGVYPSDGKATKTDYTTEPVFTRSLQGAATGELTSSEILDDTQSIINELGKKAYDDLLATARRYEKEQQEQLEKETGY